MYFVWSTRTQYFGYPPFFCPSCRKPCLDGYTAPPHLLEGLLGQWDRSYTLPEKSNAWPGHITDLGGIRNQFHHIIDIVPTILEATGIPAPEMVNGIPQRAIEGVSMAYTWDKANANAPSTHHTQYFEMMGDHALYHDGWIASKKVIRPPWEVIGQLTRIPSIT